MAPNFFDIITAEDGRGKRLGHFTLRVFTTICSKWPTNPIEVAKEHDEKGKVKTLSAKYLYHFNKLERAHMIKMKKIGNSYVAWPVDMEKLRVLHEMLSTEVKDVRHREEAHVCKGD